MYRYRNVEGRVSECLGAFRIVSLTGARQVGKTTLVRRLCEGGTRRYVTLEDPVTRGAAEADPDAWLDANPAPLAIDEVQHVPALFPAMKRRVDAQTAPGQYLITGSALWLSMRRIGESLAGRTAILEMFPFRPGEWRGGAWDWGRLFDESPHELVRSSSDRAWPSQDIIWDSVLRGGYPEPAALDGERMRQEWFESYLRTYLQRDVFDLIHIERAAEFTRLIRLLTSQTGGMMNQSALSRDLGLPQPTVRRYLEWLRTTYQCHVLSPYSTNAAKRLVKTPKFYWSDTGMAAALSGWSDRHAVEAAQKTGALIETWVMNDLHAWRGDTGGVELSFWRSHDGAEADALIERRGRVAALEVKCGHRIDARDLKGLRACRDALGARFQLGVVLYGGREAVGLEDRIVALPLGCLLG